MNAQKKRKRPFRHRFANMLQFISRRPIKEYTPVKAPESIIILAKERYGDCIMLTPLIEGLRKKYPELSIYVLTFTRMIFDFFSGDPNVTAVYHTKKNPGRYIKNVLLKKFDLLFNPKDHPSANFLVQTLLIRARYKVSHFNIFHEGLYDHLIRLTPDTHEAKRNLALLSVLDPTAQPEMCKPYLPPMSVSTDTAAFLKTVDPGKYIGINISAGHSGGHRTLLQWSELIDNFRNNSFLIFSSPDDLEEKRELEKLHPAIRQSPSTQNLYEVGEIVKKLKLLITPDTSLVHIASCFNTPLIGLYRKSLIDHSQFAPLSTLQEAIISPTPNVIDIDTETISTALRRMLKTLNT